MFTKKKKRMIGTLYAIMLIQSKTLSQEDLNNCVALYAGLAKDIGGKKGLDLLSQYANETAASVKKILAENSASKVIGGNKDEKKDL